MSDALSQATFTEWCTATLPVLLYIVEMNPRVSYCMVYFQNDEHWEVKIQATNAMGGKREKQDYNSFR